MKAALPADPTLLFIWHSPHYGGRPIQIKAGENWRKIVGPFLIYCNTGETPEAMWKDALARADREQKAWPYDWAAAPGYAHARAARQRPRPAGDQRPAGPARQRRRGLGRPGRAALRGDLRDKGGPITIDWQTDGKHYQYWTRADAAGRFTIPNARPGTYTLYAFNDGVLGDVPAVPRSPWKRARRRTSAS